MIAVMKINRLKKFLVRYAWVGPLIGFAAGFVFGPGIIWQVFDFRLKTRSSVLEQIKTEDDLYERRQFIQGEISSSISQYISIRDKFFLNKSANQSIQTGIASNYQIQNEFNISKLKLVSLIDGYNEIEINLSLIEGRPPHFFVFPLPPLPPKIAGITEEDGNKRILNVESAPQDPLVIDIEKDLAALFQQHGHKYPSDSNWTDENVAAFDPMKTGINVYARNLTDDHWTLVSTIWGTNKNYTFNSTN